MNHIYAIGDIHGQIEKLTRLLTHAELMNANGEWIGGQSTLIFMGDFVDRGEDSIAVLDLVMRLQQQAPKADGQVLAVMGNHDPMMLAACFFPDHKLSYGATFRDIWEQNGGSPREMDRLSSRHIGWLAQLPAMTMLANKLICHADSTLYYQYGRTINEVNHAFAAIMNDSDTDAWDNLLEQFSDRGAFEDSDPDGMKRAQEFLRRYGGEQIIHGHTPIAKMTRVPSEQITEAHVYAGGLCVDLDGGMYMGSRGFVYKIK